MRVQLCSWESLHILEVVTYLSCCNKAPAPATHHRDRQLILDLLLQEIINDATRQAKVAVDDARETVQHSLAELNKIQQEIERKRTEHGSTDHTEVKALEGRMRELQLHMTRSVEDASKQVQQVQLPAHITLATGHPLCVNSRASYSCLCVMADRL